MLIKICAVNSKFIHSNLAVHSLVQYYYQLCSQANLEYTDIKIHEYTVNDVYKNVLLSIISDNPDIIGFSVYIWNFDFISRLCADIKKISLQTKIILGGPEVSFGVSLDENIYDHIIVGEGERAFFCLINELLGVDIDYYKESFGYRIDGAKVSCDRIENLSEIPFIYEYGENDKKNKTDINLFRSRIIYYESSRGCPFSCSYCLSANEGNGVRYLPLERVYNDLDFFIKEETVEQVKFVDRTFNSNKNRAYSIIKYIIDNTKHTKKNINFHFEICADLLDDRIINLLGEAEPGLIQLEAGIQTTNEKILELCARKTDINKCLDNITLLLKNKNINIHVDLIAGLPGETFESFRDSFNRVYFLFAHQFQLGFLKLLKGAPLNNQIQQYDYKFSDRPPYEILGNADMTHEDLAILSQIEIVADKFYNSQKFTASLNYLIGCDNYFETPFDFYLQLSSYLLQRNLLYHPLSLANLYTILIEFAAVNPKIDISCLKEMLLLDYHSGDMYDKPPASIRDTWVPYKNYKADAINQDANLTARKIGQRFYYFDYSKKNPITNQYDYRR